MSSTQVLNADLYANSFNGPATGLTLPAVNQVVVTNGSNLFVTLNGYSTAATANTFALRDGSGNLTATSYNGSGTNLVNLTGANVNMTAGNQVVLTAGASPFPLVSAAFLGVTNGGFGVNPLTGLSSVITPGNTVVVSGGTLAMVPYTTAATPSALVQRDTNGGIALNGVTLSAGLGTFALSNGYVQTTNATPTALFTFLTSSTVTAGSQGTGYNISGEIVVGRVVTTPTNPGDDVACGIYNFFIKVKNLNNGVTTSVTGPFAFNSSLDTNLGLPTGANSVNAFTFTFTGQSLRVNVVGVASTTYNWYGSFRITQVIY